LYSSGTAASELPWSTPGSTSFIVSGYWKTGCAGTLTDTAHSIATPISATRLCRPRFNPNRVIIVLCSRRRVVSIPECVIAA
jgi:hypothetical protein